MLILTQKHDAIVNSDDYKDYGVNALSEGKKDFKVPYSTWRKRKNS